MKPKLKRFAVGAITTLISACHGSSARPISHSQQIERFQRQTVEVNALAASIHSEDDARKLVDLLADTLSDSIPSAWSSRSNLRLIARAEFQSVTNPQKLIPDQRIADAWNGYVRRINAPDELVITAAEIHNMRDADYTGARILWRPETPNIWTVPTIYAIGPDGKVANGSRAIEALRIVFDLTRFDNLVAARERIDKNMLASEMFREQPSGAPRSELRAHVVRNPVWDTTNRYVREHGESAWNEAVRQMLETLFPAETEI